MRIIEFRGPNRPGGKHLRKTGDGGGGSFVDHLDAGDSKPAEASTTGGIAALGSALFLQEIDTPLDGRTPAREHGARLLDHLDRLRMQLLLGEISLPQLRQLRQTLEQGRPVNVPPEMQDILLDIELRVRVELAKLGQ